MRNCKNCQIPIEGLNHYCDECRILYAKPLEKTAEQNIKIHERMKYSLCARCGTGLTETMKKVHIIYCTTWCANSLDFVE